MRAHVNVAGEYGDHWGVQTYPDPVEDLVGMLLTVELNEEGEVSMGRFSRVVEDAGHPLFDPQWAQQFLEQSDLWCDGSGEYLEIADMSQEHALNTVAMLVRRAPHIALVAAVGHNDLIDGRPDADEVDRIVDPILARRWIMESPLVRALVTRSSFSNAGTPPWQIRRRLITATLR